MVAREAVVQRADNGHGAHAEQEAGSDEALGDAGKAAKIQPLRFALHPVAQLLNALVQIQQLAHKGAEHHGQNNQQAVLALQRAADAQIQDAQ